MPAAERRLPVLLIGGASVALLVGAVLLAVGSSNVPPESAIEPDWDHTRCARCGMLVSEAGFAAQEQLSDGEIRHYDDPGCLLVHAQERPSDPAPIHAVYFHHRSEPRWLAAREAVFVRTEHSPMGFGLAARARGEVVDGLALEEARSLALAQAGARR